MIEARQPPEGGVPEGRLFTKSCVNSKTDRLPRYIPLSRSLDSVVSVRAQAQTAFAPAAWETRHLATSTVVQSFDYVFQRTSVLQFS
jgi:hypothetical protein